MFSQLSLHRLLTKALSDLNFIQPTDVQAETIPLAMDGCDLKVNSKTGTGKTAAYLLPMLHRLLTATRSDEGVRGLILLPTRELAQQVFVQCNAMMKYTRLSGCLVCGGEDFDLQVSTLIGDPAVVVATTGRLLEHLEMGTIDLTALEVLVLDEADRMLDMGFADDVLAIANACNPARQTMLFSATLNNKWLPKVAAKILREPQELRVGGERIALDNIREQVILSDDGDHKIQQLLWLLTHEAYEKTIVFTNSREQAEVVSNALTQQKQRAAVLHGEVTSLRRKRVMDLLHEGKIRVLVATDLAARGLDVPGIDLVINIEVPRRGDSYTHRIGRTGRAGRQGVAITLVSPLEWNLKASIERYLKRKFEPRTISDLKANYSGPKKLKSSGQAAGNKGKPDKKKKEVKKIKQRLRVKKNIGKRRLPKVMG